jgi:hypothetical protein
MDNSDVSGTKVYDKSGSNNHGTMTGTATSTGIIKQARSFNGTTDYMDMGDKSAYSISNSGLTVSGWFNVDSMPPAVQANRMWLLTKSYVNTSEWAISINSWNNFYGKLVFCHWNAAATLRTCRESNSAMVAGVWTHFAYTIADTGAVPDVYINGTLNNGTSEDMGNTTSDLTTALLIGAYTGYLEVEFDGLIDDVRIYNRALSAAEVAQLYNATKTNFPKSSVKKGMVGHWTMDTTDVSGTTIYDKSGFARNAAITRGGNGYGVTSTPGKVKQAFDFDGQTDYALASGFTDLGTSNVPYSFTGWVKIPPTETDGNIIHMVGGGWCLPPVALSSGKLRGYSWNGGGVSVAGTTNLAPGTWYHFANTWDATNGLRIFVNGVLENSTAQATYIASGISNSLYFGYSPGVCAGDTGWFNGAIDDLRVYNYSLSSQEISQIYNAAKTGFGSAPTKTGLVGHWTMDATDLSGTKVYDKSGFNRHGTRAGASGVNNTPQITSGKIKQALDFDLSDDTVTISNYPADFGTGDMSVALWFKTTTSTGTTAPLIDCAYVGAINAGFGIYMWAGDTSPRFAIDDGVSGGTTVAANNYASNNGQWHHVVGVRDTSGSNLIKIYLDGVLDNTAANIAGSISSSDDLVIGSHYSGGLSYRYNGQIDDVRVYNRALSDDEVAQIYNATKTGFGK